MEIKLFLHESKLRFNRMSTKIRQNVQNIDRFDKLSKGVKVKEYTQT